MNCSFLKVHLLKELTQTAPQDDFKWEGQSILPPTVKDSCLLAPRTGTILIFPKKSKLKLFPAVTRAWLPLKLLADLLAGRLCVRSHLKLLELVLGSHLPEGSKARLYLASRMQEWR